MGAALATHVLVLTDDFAGPTITHDTEFDFQAFPVRHRPIHFACRPAHSAGDDARTRPTDGDPRR